MNMPAETPSAIYAVWEQVGITEHMGGITATQRLLQRCRLGAGQRVLELGCGTGYTACHLAKHYQVDVTAIDSSVAMLRWTAERASKEHVRDRVAVCVADAQALPFPADTFDAALAESVLVFCEARRVIAEAHRALKPGGVFGANELTYLKPPPAALQTLLASAFGRAIRPWQAAEWTEAWKDGGFTEVVADVYPLDVFEQVRSHLRIDGAGRYLKAVWAGVSDRRIRSTFFTREMLRAAWEFSSYVGYGLYTGRKG